MRRAYNQLSPEAKAKLGLMRLRPRGAASTESIHKELATRPTGGFRNYHGFLTATTHNQVGIRPIIKHPFHDVGRKK